MNEQDNLVNPLFVKPGDANQKQWIPPQEELRQVVVRYLLTYGDSSSRTLTHMRRDLKVILAAYDE